MKILGNEKGMALVIVMLLSLIGLMIVSSLLFMVTVGTKTSGYHGFFRSADDAGLGGAQLAAQFVNNQGFLPGSGWTIPLPPTPAAACLQQKLTTSRGGWGTTNWTSCTDPKELSLDDMTMPDLQFRVPGPPGIEYLVNAKIVDTVQGNSDVSGLLLGGNLQSGGVDNSNSGTVSPPQHPYLYRMEVEASDVKQATLQTLVGIKTRYSVLYAH